MIEYLIGIIGLGVAIAIILIGFAIGLKIMDRK
jgi:hypothetical protein